MKKKKRHTGHAAGRKGSRKRSSAREANDPAKAGMARNPEDSAWVSRETDMILKDLVDKEKEILKTEEALLEAMHRFRDLFEQSPIGVAIHSATGELLIVNKAYFDIFGLETFSDITRQNLFSDMKLPRGDVEDLKKGRVIRYEHEYDFDRVDMKTSREGSAFILFTISPLFRDGGIIGYMVQMQDITENKRAEEAQRLAQLGRLLSDMAHEVNNPLMIISGRAELSLMEGIEDSSVRDSLNVILDQCFLAKDIIQRLLRYSRIGKVEKRPVDMVRILELIINILQHHFHMTNIEIKKDIAGNLPKVTGNEKQLQQVFMNIIRNSSDAMPEGGTVRISAKKEKGNVRIEVTDNGKGMEKKVLDRIFEPFFTTKQKGTGLGLAVCHTIIQEHAGKLQYKSTPGKGTTAVIMLPAKEFTGY
jgi:two-component system, sporulation sensor kinase E